VDCVKHISGLFLSRDQGPAWGWYGPQSGSCSCCGTPVPCGLNLANEYDITFTESYYCSNSSGTYRVQFVRKGYENWLVYTANNPHYTYVWEYDFDPDLVCNNKPLTSLDKLTLWFAIDSHNELCMTEICLKKPGLNYAALWADTLPLHLDSYAGISDLPVPLRSEEDFINFSTAYLTEIPP
jgi:hypothetical protein